MSSVEGQGLHSAAHAVVRFARSTGPVTLGGYAIGDLRVAGTTRSTSVESSDGRLRVGTVEHLFAALAGLGIRDGLAITLDGPEVPLACGGSTAFADAALRVLGTIAAGPPQLRVARDAELESGASRYELRVADGVGVEVEVDFDDPRIAPSARWDGDPEDFRTRIAPARTFGFEREVADLATRGLASHVAPSSVIVLGESRILCAGAPFSADEPARHKLLDLLGDLYLHGGPPRGLVRASRPGHAATHAVVARALAAGVLVRD